MQELQVLLVLGSVSEMGAEDGANFYPFGFGTHYDEFLIIPGFCVMNRDLEFDFPKVKLITVNKAHGSRAN